MREESYEKRRGWTSVVLTDASLVSLLLVYKQKLEAQKKTKISKAELVCGLLRYALTVLGEIP
jgi:hypothetical protein